MDTRQYRKSKYIKSTDVDGGAMVVTIEDVKAETMRSGDEALMVAFVELPDKFLALNGTNIDSLTNIAGSHDSDKWLGRQVELYTVPESMARTGEAVRIRKAKPAKAAPAKATTADDEFDDDIKF